MWGAFRTPDFTKGLRYKGPMSVWACLKDISICKRGLTSGRCMAYSILLRAKVVGRVWLVKRGEVWNLGYWVHPKYQRRGFATSAVSRLIDVGLGNGIQEIHAQCHEWNEASRKVLVSCGFDRVGRALDKESYVFKKYDKTEKKSSQ